ncbi:MAG: EAL domain-containing protein [Myxococcota bacterium]
MQEPTNAVRVLLIQGEDEALPFDAPPHWDVEVVARLAEARPGKLEACSLAFVVLNDRNDLSALDAIRDGAPDVPFVGIVDAIDSELAERAVTLGAQDLLLRDEVTASRLDQVVHLARERARLMAGLRESERRYARAVRGAQEGIFEWSLERDFVHFSPGWTKMIGFEQDQVAPHIASWFDRVYEDDLEGLRRAADEHATGIRDTFDAEYRIRHADGNYRWMRARGLAVRDGSGKAISIAGSQSDISQRKEAERQLRYRALHDENTGLPNRALLIDRLDRAAMRCQQHGTPFAIIAVGLDNYAAINDSFGHAVCNRWIQQLARAISNLRGPTDTLARIARDQFVLLVDNQGDITSVTRLAEDIQATLNRPAEIEGEEHYTTASLGIVMGDRERPTASEDYLRDAGVAMHRARSLGGAQHQVFDLPMHRLVVLRLQVEKELRQAAERQEFRLRYQPIVSLRSGQVAGFEALLRWEHPEQGLVTPGSFIDVAEAAGLLPTIFDAVFPEIVAQLSQWQRGPRSVDQPLFINVNLSRGQLLDPNLVERVDRVLAEHPVAPGSLGFELTESMMVDDASIMTTLRALKARDIRLLLDDFGTGYSSLANLMNFPIDAIKIDRAFLRELGAVADHTEIVRAIVSLAHSMAMDVTVEGIESEDQLRFVTGLGCEYGQGYHFAMPLGLSDASAVLGSGYRLTNPPPVSGPVSKGQSRGRVALLFAETARQKQWQRHVADLGFDSFAVEGRSDLVEHIGSSQPDVVLTALDRPSPEFERLLSPLHESPQTSTIPVLVVRRGDESEVQLADAIQAGVTDFVLESSPLPVLGARLDGLTATCRANRRLSTIAMVDELTGVYSRRFLLQALRRAVKSSSRGTPAGLAVLLVDADRLKALNASQGALEGDRVLRQIARTVDRVTRETDLVARFGGEEFVVVLQDTTREGATRVAEKIRVAVERKCETTVSIGGAFIAQRVVEELDDPSEVDAMIAHLLQQAEEAMRGAKLDGRNRVAFFDEDVASHIA